MIIMIIMHSPSLQGCHHNLEDPVVLGPLGIPKIYDKNEISKSEGKLDCMLSSVRGGGG